MANVNIQLSKEQQQYLVAAVLFLGGGGFGYVKYFWMPTSEKIAKTEEEIKTVDGKIKKAKKATLKLDKIKKELARLNEQASEAEKRLPQEQDLTGVIELMTDLCREYNITLNSMSAGSARKQQYFIEISYSLNTEATFHDLGRFLAAIALEERIFNVRNVRYGTPGTDGKMSVGFQLISYQYKG